MNQLLNVDQVSETLGISKNTLYFYTQNKQIPFIKVGRHLRFKRRSLDKWLRERSTKVENNLNTRV